MNQSHIDELIDINYLIKSKILNNQAVFALMSNNPNIDLDSDEADEISLRIKDHDYVDETSLSANSYIIIETEVSNLSSSTMKTLLVYVQIICSKGYMDLDPKIFKGIKGNRRDNIARLIDNMLNNTTLEFGVGTLRLSSAIISSLPTGYTGRTLTYAVPNFA